MRRPRATTIVVALLLTGSMVGVAAPASATSPKVTGDAYFDKTGVCPPKKHYTSYDPIVMTGSLKGCWYTDIQQSWTSGGDYLERGRELFVGTLYDGKRGSFRTSYLFEAKLDKDGKELSGGCQHPIVPGSGKHGFKGASGIVYFRDIVTTDPTTYVYTGEISR